MGQHCEAFEAVVEFIEAQFGASPQSLVDKLERI